MNSLDYRGSLEDEAALAAALSQAGDEPDAASARAALLAQAAALVPEASARRAFCVPGRIEVFGKHTDYAGGRTMVVAAQRGLALVAAPRGDRAVRISSVTMGQTVAFDLEPDLVPQPGHWSNYPMTVARRIARNFPGPLAGADVAFASDLPLAAGMSSSSALVVGVFLVLAEINRLEERPEFKAAIADPTDLAGYLGTIENGQSFGPLAGDRGVGTFGGSEDHTAILHGQPGRISQYSYCPVRFERTVDLPRTHVFAVAASGVIAEKTGAAKDLYNAVSARAAALLDVWRGATGQTARHLAEILATGPGAAERLARHVAASRRDDFDADSLARRLAHFQAESHEIIPAAGDALVRGDLAAFGREAARSQDLAERLLGNQVPETSALAALALQCGADAASSFGAGFGGSVWALVARTRADSFLDQWREAYASAFPHRAPMAAFFTTSAGPGALRVVHRLF
ncbi:MAG: hypothetical protein JW809_01915 [Pirellulales bacterium]|nr:hypothetical protein [Pirellulales bacterium]